MSIAVLASLLACAAAFAPGSVVAFTFTPACWCHRSCRPCRWLGAAAFAPAQLVGKSSTCLDAFNAPRVNFSFRLSAKSSGGKGFGKSGGGFGSGSNDRNDEKELSVEKTYGASAKAPIKDLIDAEAAMSEFFAANEEWSPLFRSIASHSSVPAMSFLGGQHGGDVEFLDHSPWKKLDPIPSGEENISVLSSFLDSAQRSLVQIPVSDGKEDDENDLQFIEEGRRMLVISRFHVLSGVTSGEIDHHEALFRTCWSELLALWTAGEEDTGSLIVLPDYDISDLRRFTDMNLQRPLDWLGMSDLFEVTSLQRESPAIRLIHKLSNIPELEGGK